MQDRYVGDVGDFSKFALLRLLQREVRGSTGVIWYRFPNEDHNKDGRHVAYFGNSKWQVCDNDLITSLRAIVETGKRYIGALESSNILPKGTKYFAESIHPGPQADWLRSSWFERAKVAVASCDIVLVDPDNGIAGRNHNQASIKGGKHVTLDEIAALAADHSCLVIYHHFDRSASHFDQVHTNIRRLKSLIPDRDICCVRYKRVSPRAYFLVTQSHVVTSIERALASVSTEPWKYHFDVFR